MKHVVILKNLLSDEELDSLVKDCTQASERFTTEEQYAETSCAIDLFELSPLEDEGIRKDRDKYFNERWKYCSSPQGHQGHNKMNPISPKDKSRIVTTLCSTLPTALNYLLHKDDIYLFNEHYVVKPPDSNITFRWHRDADEQLQFCYDQSKEYYSMWCPLDDVSAANGTLQVPQGTDVYTIDVAELRVNIANKSAPLAKLTPSNAYTRAANETYASTKCSDENEKGKMLENGNSDGDDSDYNVTCSPDCSHAPFNLIVPRGCGVVFSSLLWHCSGPNLSANPRRVLYAQYSDSVISSQQASYNVRSSPDSSTFLRNDNKSEKSGAITKGEAVTVTGHKRKKSDNNSPTTPTNSTIAPLCFAVPCDIR